MGLLPDNLSGSAPKPPAPPKPPVPPKAPPKAPPLPKPPAPAKGGGLGALRVSLIPSSAGEEGEPNLRRRVLVLLLVVVAEALLFGGVYVYLLQLENGRKAELESLLTRRDAVTTRLAEVQEQTGEMFAFARQTTAVVDALDKHTRWTSFFDHLEAVTIPNVRYLNFTGDAETGVINLSAVARNYRDMAEQIVVLQEDPMIKEVRSRSAVAKISDLGEVVGVSFSVILEVEPAAWLVQPSGTLEGNQ